MIPTADGFRPVQSNGEAERNSINIKTDKGVAAYMKSNHRVDLEGEELAMAYQALQSVGGNRQAFEDLINGEVVTKDNWFWFTGDHETVENWKAIRKAAGTVGSAMRSEATRQGKIAARPDASALSAEDFVKRLTTDIADKQTAKEAREARAQQEAAGTAGPAPFSYADLYNTQ